MAIPILKKQIWKFSNFQYYKSISKEAKEENELYICNTGAEAICINISKTDLRRNFITLESSKIISIENIPNRRNSSLKEFQTKLYYSLNSMMPNCIIKLKFE